MLVMGGVMAALVTMSACATEPIHESAFERAPLRSGWIAEAGHNSMDPPLGWQPAADGEPAHVFMQRGGTWKSPLWRHGAEQYLAVKTLAKLDEPTVWHIDGFTAQGLRHTADHYATLDPTIEATRKPVAGDEAKGQWAWYTMMVRPRHGSAASRWSVHGPRQSTARVAAMKVDEASDQQVLAWADSVYAALTPVTYDPPADRWRLLPRTRGALESGRPLRIVLLGDSIANDTGNSPLSLLLERAWPGSAITIINSIRGSTGCQYYQKNNRVKPYVFGHNPDLLILAGISHGFDEKAMASVIDQVRAGSENPPEIIVSTGAVAKDPREEKAMRDLLKYKMGRTPTDKQVQHALGFFDRVEAMAAAKGVAFFDVRDAWEKHVASSGRPVSEFRRDYLHANTRGRAVLSRLWLRYLGPDAP